MKRSLARSAWTYRCGGTSRRARFERVFYTSLAYVRPLSGMGEPNSTKNCLRGGEPDHTVPSGTGHVRLFPRHFVPGCFHKVPIGQNLKPLTRA